MAPEVMLRRPYNEKADIFSLACCIVEVSDALQVLHKQPVRRHRHANNRIGCAGLCTVQQSWHRCNG